jgi:prepilin-type processing-associated H-X9-DG protein
MEKGHLVEKYMYLNGGMVLFLDGHLRTESLAQDPRH